MIRNFTATVLLAGAIAAVGIAVPVSASAATMTCYGTAGSKVDPISSCVATPGQVTPVEQVDPYWHHHRGLRIALNHR